MTIQDALELAIKIASGKFDPDDLKRFLDYLQDTDVINRNRVMDAYDEAISRQASYGSFVEPDFMDRLKALRPDPITENTFAEIYELQEVRSFRWRRIAVAATILTILSTSAYFLFFAKPKAEIAQTERIYKNDIAPGGNKAILTLANGSTIILDSAHLGKLAQQGNAFIQKLDSGSLAYAVLAERPSAILYNTLTTPKGGQYHLKLPDGSLVWLNAASSIKYPVAFFGNRRKVEITGEVYFEVAKNAKMPFQVAVKQLSVEVMGTHFNINAYDDEEKINTTLIEGAVKITKNNETKLLKPGEQAQVTASDIQIVEDVDIEKIVAWKDGKFIFSRDELPSIMRELKRWYDVEVEYKSSASAGHFSGIISRNRNASQVLNMLKATGNIKFDIDGKKIIVLP